MSEANDAFLRLIKAYPFNWLVTVGRGDEDAMWRADVVTDHPSTGVTKRWIITDFGDTPDEAVTRAVEGAIQSLRRMQALTPQRTRHET